MDSVSTAVVYVVIVVLPVSLSVSIAVDNRFRSSAKSKTLQAAATHLVSEIYKYRARGVEYGVGVGAISADDILAARCSAITTVRRAHSGAFRLLRAAEARLSDA